MADLDDFSSLFTKKNTIILTIYPIANGQNETKISLTEYGQTFDLSKIAHNRNSITFDWDFIESPYSQTFIAANNKFFSAGELLVCMDEFESNIRKKVPLDIATSETATFILYTYKNNGNYNIYWAYPGDNRPEAPWIQLRK